MSETIEYKHDLPNGWSLIKFNECCENIPLNGIKIKQKQYKNSGIFPVIDQGRNLIGGYFDDEKLLIPSEPPYIVFGDHTKVKKYVSFNFIAGADGVKVLKPFGFINPKLLYYFIHAIKVPDKGYARHFQFLANADFPIPPINEQKRIIDKIEELITDLDKGIEYLKTAQKQIRIYRRAVLKWTFEGKNQKNKAYILKDIAKVQIGPFGTQLHKEDYIVDGIPLINPMHIQEGKIVANRAYTITKKKKDSLPNYILKVGDVIMGRRGEMARCGLVTEKEDGWFCGTGSLYLRPNKKLIHSKYLYCFLTGDTAKSYLEEKAGGTTMANLNLKIVNNMPIYLPSIDEQIKIVHEIESRISVCDKIEETIESSLQQAEALRLSIIKKAFEGKLVPQNPSDEHAEKLLERIRAAKGKTKPVKKEKVEKTERAKRKMKIEI